MAEVEKIKLTKEGKKRLEEEYRHLIDVERPQNKEELVEARAQGDLSENADYDAAREKQGKIESRITEIEHILSHCVIIKEASKKSNKIGLGSTFVYERIDNGQQFKYTITGTTEADPFAGKISNSSPLGIALTGHEKDDVVLIKAVHGEYEVKVIDVINE